MKYLFRSLFWLTFVIALSASVRPHLSVDAIAVLVGVVIGVIASLPATFLLAWLILRSH